MTRRQWIVILVLGLADCLVLGGLAAAVWFTPRLATRGGPAGPPESAPTQPPSATLPPTWTPTPSPSPAPTRTPRPTSTPGPTATPLILPTATPTPTPTPQPVELANADFIDILPDRVPGWEMAALVNWQPGQEFNPDSSYVGPLFKAADDARRVIQGSTLQIESEHPWVKFQVTLYQTVDVPPGSRVRFEIMTNAYSDQGGFHVRAGIDPSGSPACQQGVWTDPLVIDQNSGLVTLRTSEVAVGQGGRVTVCFFAEPQYATLHKAVFFDNARLTVTPPE